MLKFYRLCFNLCPKFAHYAQIVHVPIISGRNKLLCSNNCITLLYTLQFHHQSHPDKPGLGAYWEIYTSRLQCH